MQFGCVRVWGWENKTENHGEFILNERKLRARMTAANLDDNKLRVCINLVYVA